jgi:hypothetical protein
MADSDTPSDTSDAMLDWAEARGIEHLREQISSMDALKSESATTFTVLLAAAGATLAFVIQSIDKGQYGAMTMGACALLAYLFGLGCILVVTCMRISDAPTVSNRAKNLYQPTFSLKAVKEEELKNIEERTTSAILRNVKTAKWLNRVRIGLLFSPIVFLIGCSLKLICAAAG